jgi:hypothetical protein
VCERASEREREPRERERDSARERERVKAREWEKEFITPNLCSTSVSARPPTLLPSFVHNSFNASPPLFKFVRR